MYYADGLRFVVFYFVTIPTDFAPIIPGYTTNTGAIHDNPCVKKDRRADG